MKKFYQNNNNQEQDEIDGELIKIFENKEKFTANCYDSKQIYVCIFREKPPKGQGILSAEICQ